MSWRAAGRAPAIPASIHRPQHISFLSHSLFSVDCFIEGHKCSKGPKRADKGGLFTGINDSYLKVTLGRPKCHQSCSELSFITSFFLPLGALFSEKPLWGRSETRKTERRRLYRFFLHDDRGSHMKSIKHLNSRPTYVLQGM